jgi:hypothetical protein
MEPHAKLKNKESDPKQLRQKPQDLGSTFESSFSFNI